LLCTTIHVLRVPIQFYVTSALIARAAQTPHSRRISAHARVKVNARRDRAPPRDLRDRRSGTFLARVTAAMAGLFRFGARRPATTVTLTVTTRNIHEHGPELHPDVQI
jgi:hypothetical protein